MIQRADRAEAGRVLARCMTLLARREGGFGAPPNARGAGPESLCAEAAGAWRGESYASCIDQGAGDLDARGGRHGTVGARHPPLLEPRSPITDSRDGRPEPCRD